MLSIGLTIVGRGLYLLTQIVAARALGSEGFGIFALAWTLAGISIIFSNLGIPQNAIRFDVSGRTLWTTGYLPLGLASTVLAAVALFALADPLSLRFFHSVDVAPVIRAIAPSVPLTVCVSIAVSGFKLDGRPLLGIGFATIGLSVGPLLCIWIATQLVPAPDPTRVALAYSLGLLPGAVLALWLTYLRSEGRPARLPSRVEQVRFGFQSLLVHSVGILNMWIDRLMMGFFSMPTDLGHYQAASQLSMIPMMLGATITSLYEARLARSTTLEARTRNFVEAQLYQVHAISLGCLIGIFTAPFWLGLTFGPEFIAGGAILALLLLGQIARALGGPAVVTLSMAGLPQLALRVTVISLVANLALNFVLIPPFGGSGAAAANAIAALVLSAQAVRLCLKRGLIASRFDHLRAPAISFAASLLAIAAVHVALEPSATRVATTILAGGLAYTLPLAFIGRISELDHFAASTRRLFGRTP